jgi:hypothetical protein
LAADLTDAPALRLQDGDLLALFEAHVTGGQWGQADGRHPASFSEPPSANRGCHAHRDRCVLTRLALRDLDPEPLSLVALPTRRPSGRVHLASHRPRRLLLLPNTHPETPPSSRCCDDQLNPPNAL